VNAWEASTGWDAFLKDHPEAHLLQTGAWAALKSAFGWSAHAVQAGETGAMLLVRQLAPGFKLAYIPRGPVGGGVSGLLPELDRFCRAQSVFCLKLEPDARWDEDSARTLKSLGFEVSPQPIQPARTIVVDLQPDEDSILARMKQKTRYNIRLAARKDVTVRPWDDIAGFARMMAVTAARDEFGAHSQAYYQKAYDLFHPDACELFLAEYQGEPLAALMVFARGRRAWYFYGASRDAHREKMPTYLLQWEAMRWARGHGCKAYDMWGIPDYSEDELEAGFQGRSDGLWGVYRFKRGFGGEVVRSMGAWDRAYKPLHYAMYKLGLRLIGRGAG
jgi:peptidoglycan pentaglycine glycine transferase (the first glycine)